MKKIIFIILSNFLFFSCNLNTENSEFFSWSLETNTWVEERSYAEIFSVNDNIWKSVKNSHEFIDLVKNTKNISYIRMPFLKDKEIVFDVLDELLKRRFKSLRLDIHFWIISSWYSWEFFEKLAKLKAEEISLDIWADSEIFTWEYSFKIPNYVAKMFVENKGLALIWIWGLVNPYKDYKEDKDWNISVKDYSYAIRCSIVLDDWTHWKIYEDKLFCWDWIDYISPDTEFFNKYYSKTKYFK